MFSELTDFGAKSFLAKVTVWPLFVKCRQHSCSNAIFWAMKLINSVLEDVKNPYICIESLRNTCSALLDHIPEFVKARVEFTHIRSASFVERALLWRSFGVDERMVEDVAAMDPLWENGRLWVIADFEHDEKVYDSL